jgi:hypothetical protein
MTALDKIRTDDLDFALAGMPKRAHADFIDPAYDPALKLPNFGFNEDLIEPGTGVPSAEEIEKVLIDHVKDNATTLGHLASAKPIEMICEMFSPFLNDKSLSLSPGAGLKRPSYMLEITPFNVIFQRAPVRVIAEGLREYALRLSVHPVGPRAPEGAPTFFVQTQHSTFQVKAPSAEAACRATEAMTGCPFDKLYVPLNFSAEDIIPHVLAARHVLAEKAVGAVTYRQKAADLIGACQDLCTAATVVMRRNLDPQSQVHHDIKITRDPDLSIIVTDSNFPYESSHAQLAFMRRSQTLCDTLKQVMQSHPGLQDLPEGFQIQMHGRPEYLSLKIHDTSAPKHSPGSVISPSELEYSRIDDLTERLMSGYRDQHRNPAWVLKLPFSCRAIKKWDCQGKTFAHALAECAGQGSADHSTACLGELLIDLLSADIEVGDVQLYRVLDSL